MLGPKFGGGSEGVRPVKFDVRPISDSHFLFEQSDHSLRFALSENAGAFGLAETVQDFNALPRSPNNFRIRFLIKEPNCIGMMNIVATFVGEPPRSVGIQLQFLSEARNAVPSNFFPLGFPTARDSASLLVILGQDPLLTTNFGLP